MLFPRGMTTKSDKTFLVNAVSEPRHPWLLEERRLKSEEAAA